MDKISALRKTNNLINERIKSFEKLNYSQNSKKTFINENLLIKNKKDLSFIIQNIKEKQVFKTNNELKRIVILKGELKVIVSSNINENVQYLDELNTIVIPPYTEYSLESINESKIIIITKPKGMF